MTLEEAIQNMKKIVKNAPNEYEKSVQDGLQLLCDAGIKTWDAD